MTGFSTETADSVGAVAAVAPVPPALVRVSPALIPLSKGVVDPVSSSKGVVVPMSPRIPAVPRDGETLSGPRITGSSIRETDIATGGGTGNSVRPANINRYSEAASVASDRVVAAAKVAKVWSNRALLNPGTSAAQCVSIGFNNPPV